MKRAARNAKFRELLASIGWIWFVLVQAVSGSLQLYMNVNITPVLYGVLAVLLLTQAKSIFKFYKDEIYILGIILFSIVCTLLFHPENGEYFMQALPISYLFIIFYFIGKIMCKVDNVRTLIHQASKIGVGLAYIAYLTSLGARTKDMSFAYAVLPQVIGCIDAMYKERKMSNVVFSAMGVILLFFLGTRGPLLIAFIFLMLKFFVLTKNLRSKIILVILTVFGIWFVVTQQYIAIIKMLDEFLQALNINSFIFYLLLTKNTASIDERGEIQRKVFDGISQNWLFGSGLFGDRIFAGNYSHNIVLEILCSYGVPLGICLIMLLLYYGISVYKKCRLQRDRDFLIICACSFLLKFFLSASFVTDTGFYMMLGILCGYNHKKAEKMGKMI